MAHVVPDLPSTKASQATFSTYYLALVDDYDPVKSGMTAFETAEMNAALALITKGASSNITKLFAVDSGNWNTAANWYPSGVPGAGAYVCIPEGTVCTYNLDAPSTELFAVRVDGELSADPALDTAMLFDTMVITPLGFLRDGRRTNRVSSSKTHEWIIATSNGLIDVSWDTFFQSRGIISLGEVDLWGFNKTPFLEVTSYSGPSAGATSLTLESEPTGWAVGDQIMIGATIAGGSYYDSGTQITSTMSPRNEVRTLTSVSGSVLGWTSGLTYNHTGFASSANHDEYKCYVSNLTRNIVFRPDDAAAPIHHRGHMMQMHQYAGWNMRDAEIQDLGRTSKIGGYNGRVHTARVNLTAGNALDLTGSPYWNGSALVLGPTFTLRFSIYSATIGSFTITGTDEDGGAQTETFNYGSGTTASEGSGPTLKYFLTVTSIVFTTDLVNTHNTLFSINAQSRQLNENGVRNLQSGSAVYTTVKNTVNIQGRYPFHIHKIGISGSVLTNPPVIDNCSFHGSPGWLLAQHQSHAIVKNCVFYDAPGAGLVAEDGNETGIWIDCLSAGNIGNDDGTHKDGQDLIMKDPARSGTAFWFTGRLIHVSGCIAIGSAGGHVYNTRLSSTQSGAAGTSLLVAQHDQPTSKRGASTTDCAVVPLGHFTDNISVGCVMGFTVIKSDPAQNDDLRTPLIRFKSWSCPVGMDITYTAHYSMIDCNCLAGSVAGNLYASVTTGIGFFTNSSDQVIVNPVVEGFYNGLSLYHGNTVGGFETSPDAGRWVVNPTYTSCSNNIIEYDSNIDFILSTGDLNSNRPALSAISTTGTITGTKTDELGSISYPFGQDTFANTRSTILTSYGYYTDVTDGHKYVLMDEWFSSRYTGQMDKVIIPIDVNDLSVVGKTNNGSTDLANNTAPSLADFSVSITRNTNLTIDIVGRATGNTVRFGGFQRPMKSNLIDNGDGTITIIPLTDENYSETCYVWVDDVNGNTTRATMTINVNKRALYLGRQDLL